jgi:hypothetical protein
MKVERYVTERHYDAFCKWMRFYEIDPIEPGYLPSTGFVIEGLACCFLYRTDSKLALIEGLVGNPYAPKAESSRALDLVVEATIAEARQQGFGVLQGYTSFDAVVQRAVRHGFGVDGSTFRLVGLPLE